MDRKSRFLIGDETGLSYTVAKDSENMILVFPKFHSMAIRMFQPRHFLASVDFRLQRPPAILKHRGEALGLRKPKLENTR